MTREELTEVRRVFDEANGLIGFIDELEKLSSQNFSLRKNGIDVIDRDMSEKIIAAGIKALREEAESTLSKLRLWTQPPVVAPIMPPPLVWPTPHPSPYQPVWSDHTNNIIHPTTGDGAHE